jgi:hypothetical protein
MRRWKYRNTILAVTGSAALLLLFGAAYIYGIPGSPVSIFAFKLGYQLSWDRHAYLQVYSPVYRDVNAKSLPPEVDAYLCSRVDASEDPDEIVAIADLYVLQAGGREGNCIFLVRDSAKSATTDHLIQRLERDDELSYKIVILLEEIRLGESLGKGNLGMSSLETDVPATADEWQYWTERTGLPTAKQKFIEWWHLPGEWEEKTLIDPLAGTKVRVQYCCG